MRRNTTQYTILTTVKSYYTSITIHYNTNNWITMEKRVTSRIPFYISISFFVNTNKNKLKKKNK